MHVTAFTLEFTQVECRTAVPSGIDLVHICSRRSSAAEYPTGHPFLGHVDGESRRQARVVMRDLENDLSKQYCLAEANTIGPRPPA